jgi:diguanylate cyclase (GGDEF)-like protein
MAKKKKDFSSIINDYDKKIQELKKKAETDKGFDELVKENRYFRTLLELTRSINTPRDFNQLLSLIVDSAINLTKAERGFLMLFRKDGNLEFRATRNIDKKTMEGEQFRISRTVVNHVLASGESVLLSDIYKNKKFKVSDSIEELGLRMVMCVPLKAKDNPLGLIYVDSSSATETFTQAEERIFEAFAAQASAAIENSYLYDASVHDALTGLYNYGYLHARLEEEVNRALRYKKDSISFLMLDLDNFKSMNEAYGHLFGNTILVKVAELIKESIRRCDIAARYGGDEFVILMPETNLAGAKQLAKRLQKEIANLKFPYGKEPVSVTSSIMVSSFPIDKIANSEDIIVEANHALFVAKSKGGNQIAVFGLRKEEKKLEPELIGTSKAMDEIRNTIAKFASTDATVLIIGETGTGKERVADLIHDKSNRAEKPLIVVNCGAIPDNLLESELFGHEKGAFTGAYTQHKGKFETAQGGTIFLDEIGELPLHLQVKLLRAIEQKEIDRIGSKTPIKVDIRMIAATNKNLEEEVKNGNFRRDLYYRLSVATLYLPPLRERPEDIEVLAEYYLKHMNQQYRRKFLGFTKDAMKAMMNHPWSGNVRELMHRIERAVIMGTGQHLNDQDLGFVSTATEEPVTLKELKQKVEMDSVVQALIRNRWNISRSAKELGISRWTLNDLIKKYDLKKSNT